MSPTLAIESPVFWFYSGLASGLLAAAGVLLTALKYGLRRNLAHAWSAYRGWLYIVPLLLLAYFLGRPATIGFLTLLSALACFEFARATGLWLDRALCAVVGLGIVALGVACWVNEPAGGQPGWYGLFMALPVFVIVTVLAVPVFRNRSHQQLRPLSLAIFAFVYFGWMFGHLTFLTNSPHAYSYLGYLVLAVALNDVAAYVCGKLFGRRLLRSHVSPKKTWEGALGGLCASLLLTWALWFTFPHFELRDVVLCGLIVGIGAQLGDLVVSVIKRDLGIKDMGSLIPGHGGVLDRVDSLIYVAPLLFHYIHYRFGLGGWS